MQPVSWCLQLLVSKNWIYLFLSCFVVANNNINNNFIFNSILCQIVWLKLVPSNYMSNTFSPMKTTSWTILFDPIRFNDCPNPEKLTENKSFSNFFFSITSSLKWEPQSCCRWLKPQFKLNVWVCETSFTMVPDLMVEVVECGLIPLIRIKKVAVRRGTPCLQTFFFFSSCRYTFYCSSSPLLTCKLTCKKWASLSHLSIRRGKGMNSLRDESSLFPPALKMYRKGRNV